MISELKRFAHGFVYAWNGIRAAVQEERNFRFHLCAAFYAVWVSFLAELSAVEWALVFLCLGGVTAMELMNSAVERAVDKPDTTHWWSAGAAKDMAAGAVLLMALAALAVGLALFVPRLDLILAKLTAGPLSAVCFFAPLLLWLPFVFLYGKNHNTKTEKGENSHDKTNP